MIKPLHKLTLAVKGKITTGIDPITLNKVTMVYQRVCKGLGNIEIQGRYDLQLRRQAVIVDKRSPLQLQCRRRIRAATNAWKTLTITDRNKWKKKATHIHITGYNLFVKEFCSINPLTEYTDGSHERPPRIPGGDRQPW